MFAPWKKSSDQPRQHIRKQRHYFANRGPSSQGYGFSSGHVCMWELDYKESWVQKNWCFWTMVLEKTLESPLECEEIQPVHPKGNQSWIFTVRTDAEDETPILGLLMWRTDPSGKPWYRARLKVWKRDDRGWNGWMVSLSWWTCAWVNSVSWWWTGRPGVLRSMGSESVGHDWATKLNLFRCLYYLFSAFIFSSHDYCLFVENSNQLRNKPTCQYILPALGYTGQGLQSLCLLYILFLKEICIISFVSKDHLSRDKWTLDQSSMTEIRGFGVEGKKSISKTRLWTGRQHKHWLLHFSSKLTVTSK